MKAKTKYGKLRQNETLSSKEVRFEYLQCKPATWPANINN